MAARWTRTHLVPAYSSHRVSASHPFRILHQQFKITQRWRSFQHSQVRAFSSHKPHHQQEITSPSAPAAQASEARENVPSYEMTFTCKTCQARSTHRISKQGYHHGTVLVQCPGCKNRHLIADHLKIFSDKPVTLEDILKEKGLQIKTGTLSAEGDVEIWDDGTRTAREAKGGGDGQV